MSQGRPLRILFASSEVVGFAKTGGLADVVGSLPLALARRGHQCAVILPLYRGARAVVPAPQPTSRVLWVRVGPRTVAGRLWLARLKNSDVPVYLIEQDAYFDRDNPADRRGIYQYTDADGSKRDYDDNCERFVFFSRAILEALPLLDVFPEILHVNDWQASLVPVYLNEEYRHRTDQRLGLRYDQLRTLLTIHNIAFQGVFWHYDLNLAGLSWRLFNPRHLEYYGKINFLKGGVVFADLVNTVSPSYAREIQTPYYGCGLQGVLTEAGDRLCGIVNGVDYTEWSPEIDMRIPARYSANDLSGKAVCKQALQKELGLAVESQTPLLGVVARLTNQKGVDLIGEVAPDLLRQGVQIALLGDGEARYHQLFEHLHHAYPGRMGLRLGFSEGLAHLIEAGSDMYLMPSAFEPSGLNQLYSLRYGTPPIVRATGGLADTVTDTTPETLAAGTATGFSFAAYNALSLRETIDRAITLWRNEPETWRQVMRNGMKQDWSWDRSAAEYEKLYRRLQG